MSRLATAAAVSLLTVFAIGTAAGSAQARTFFPQAQDPHSLAYKPRTLAISGIGTFLITDMKWKSWGHSAARGTGIGAKDDCEPDCATGTYHKAPARVTLRRPRRPCGPRIWTKIIILWTSGPPSGLPYELSRREVWSLSQFPC